MTSELSEVAAPPEAATSIPGTSKPAKGNFDASKSTPGRPYAVSRASRKDSKLWSQEEILFEDLAGWAANPDDHKECGNYLMGTLRDGRRTKNTVVSRSAVQLDADKADEQLVADAAALGVLGIVHTTFSSAPDALRLRIVLPLDREVTPAEYVHIVEALMDRLGRAKFDSTTSQAERYMFRPAVADEHRAWYRHEVLDGPELVADEWLHGFTAEDPDAFDGDILSPRDDARGPRGSSAPWRGRTPSPR